MRLFIAITPPDEVRNGVWTASRDLRETGFPIRWVKPAGIHLTLKFLGQVEPIRVKPIAAGLSELAARTGSFGLSLERCTAFPDTRNPRVVWVGLEAPAALELLQHGVESAMRELGFPVEGRTFRPHLTLGRIKRNARRPDLVHLEEKLATTNCEGEFAVTRFHLIESKLSSEGAAYSTVESFDLRRQ